MYIRGLSDSENRNSNSISWDEFVQYDNNENKKKQKFISELTNLIENRVKVSDNKQINYKILNDVNNNSVPYEVSAGISDQMQMSPSIKK